MKLQLKSNTLNNKMAQNNVIHTLSAVKTKIYHTDTAVIVKRPRSFLDTGVLNLLLYICQNSPMPSLPLFSCNSCTTFSFTLSRCCFTSGFPLLDILLQSRYLPTMLKVFFKQAHQRLCSTFPLVPLAWPCTSNHFL